jgi:hypothetical protein
VEVPFDRPPAEEQHRADLRVGEAVAGEACDLTRTDGSPSSTGGRRRS